MGRKNPESTSNGDKAFLSMPKKEQAAYLKNHELLQTCSKDKPDALPKYGELVWARVQGSAFWPGFILELTDLDPNATDDDIDDTAYGFVMFLEKTFRYAPVAWEQVIPFNDMETQMTLIPYFNKLVVKKTWKQTSIYKSSLLLAREFSKLSQSERLEQAVANYNKQVKKVKTPQTTTNPTASLTPNEANLRPEEAINKVISTVRDKKKSGLRVSERISEKQIVKLKPKPTPKSTATKKTDISSEDKAAGKKNIQNKNQRPEIGGEVLKKWTRDRFNSYSKQYVFESTNVHCKRCDQEILPDDKDSKTCHGAPYHSSCLVKMGDGPSTFKCEMCINQRCCLCKTPSDEAEQTYKCSKCELRFHISCLSKDWPQAEIQGSCGPITCPLHFCHTCLGEQKIYSKFRDYTTSSSRSYKCKLCLSTYHKSCLPAGCGENIQGKEFIICPKHTLPELKVHQRRIGCLGCYKPLKPKEEKVDCSLCIQAFHPECVGYTGEIRDMVSLEVFGYGYKCFSCRWGLFPLYGQVVWFQQPQSQYWPARILFPSEYKRRKSFAKRLPGQYSVEYFGSTSFYDNASRALPLHLTTVDIFKTMKVYQEIPKILRAHEEAAFCFIFSDEYRDKQLPQPKPVYKKIEKNVYRAATLQKVSLQKVKESAEVCPCSEEKTEFVCLPDSGCTNRDMEMECNNRTCKGGARCRNRMFSERKNDEEFLEQKLFPHKGWGVVAKKPFKPGDFVAEYRGEVIDGTDMKWRLSKKEEEDPLYIMEISKELFIDAEYVGNMSRLINHSCDPNCDVRKYLSMGRSVGGIFARRSIEVGEEVTFRYGCGSESTAPFRCRCGAKNCTVFVGKDVPDDYSVEEDPEHNQDKWDDVCSKCGYGGRVICCEFPACRKVWHYQCIGLHRQPGKNWCCPIHPARRVAQLKKASEAGNKKTRKSNSNSAIASTQAKSLPSPQQQVKKKTCRQNTPPSVQSVATSEQKVLVNGLKKEQPPLKSQKRKRNSVSAVFDSDSPTSVTKKKRATQKINCKTVAENIIQACQEPQTSQPVRAGGRNLRSSKTLSPTEAETLVETTIKPHLSTKCKISSTTRTAIESTPAVVPEGRRKRAASIPVKLNLDSSAPNTRSQRTRRGESMNERVPTSKKTDEVEKPLCNTRKSVSWDVLKPVPSSQPFINEIKMFRKSFSELEQQPSGIDGPRMSRRRSRNCKINEPFSPLALNPCIPPRELTPVHVSDTLSSSDKHVTMGTRSTSISSALIESPSFNLINGYSQHDAFASNLDESEIMDLSKVKEEPFDTGYEEDSYRLDSSLEETRNKRSRIERDSDMESGISTASSDSDLKIIFQKTMPNPFSRMPRQYSGDQFTFYRDNNM